MRGLVYGSVIGGMIVATIGAFCCLRYDIRSAEDLKRRLQTGVTPLSMSIQERVEPFKQRGQRWAQSLKVRETVAHLMQSRGSLRRRTNRMRV